MKKKKNRFRNSSIRIFIVFICGCNVFFLMWIWVSGVVCDRIHLLKMTAYTDFFSLLLVECSKWPAALRLFPTSVLLPDALCRVILKAMPSLDVCVSEIDTKKKIVRHKYSHFEKLLTKTTVSIWFSQIHFYFRISMLTLTEFNSISIQILNNNTNKKLFSLVIDFNVARYRNKSYSIYSKLASSFCLFFSSSFLLLA